MIILKAASSMCIEHTYIGGFFVHHCLWDIGEFVQTTEKESRTEILMGLPVQTFELSVSLKAKKIFV